MGKKKQNAHLLLSDGGIIRPCDLRMCTSFTCLASLCTLGNGGTDFFVLPQPRHWHWYSTSALRMLLYFHHVTYVRFEYIHVSMTDTHHWEHSRTTTARDRFARRCSDRCSRSCPRTASRSCPSSTRTPHPGWSWCRPKWSPSTARRLRSSWSLALPRLASRPPAISSTVTEKVAFRVVIDSVARYSQRFLHAATNAVGENDEFHTLAKYISHNGQF